MLSFLLSAVELQLSFIGPDSIGIDCRTLVQCIIVQLKKQNDFINNGASSTGNNSYLQSGAMYKNHIQTAVFSFVIYQFIKYHYFNFGKILNIYILIKFGTFKIIYDSKINFSVLCILFANI